MRLEEANASKTSSEEKKKRIPNVNAAVTA
jgi:hypothetical protein